MQVEFLDDEPADRHGAAAGHRTRRIVIALLCLAVAALVAVVLVNRDHPAPRHGAVATTGGIAPTGAGPLNRVPPDIPAVLGTWIDPGPNGALLDAVAVGRQIFALVEAFDTAEVQLRALDTERGRVLWAMPLHGLAFNALPFLHLVADPSAPRLWIVSEGTDPAPVRVFATDAAARLPDVAVPATVYGTAVLGGHLYLATTAGVLDVAPGAPRAAPMAGSAALVAAIAADPERGRLLALDAQSPLHLYAVTPGAGVRLAATLPPVGVSSIAVVGGVIWLGGYSDTGSTVVRLAPDGLGPVDVSPVSGLLGPGTHVVAGTRDLFVTAGTSPVVQAWCVDSRTGAVLSSWTGLTGTISSADGRIYAVTGAGLRSLPAGACAG